MQYLDNQSNMDVMCVATCYNLLIISILPPPPTHQYACGKQSVLYKSCGRHFK